MENQEEIINQMFGKDYKEKIIDSLMRTELDIETNKLFVELCEEINSSMITSIELINLIKVLPHNLCLLVIDKQKVLDENELSMLLRAVEYDEFIKDVNTFVRKNISKFEIRYASNLDQKDRRILTCEEIECLINKVINKSNIEDKSFKNTHEEYDGDNKYLRLLVRVRQAVKKRDNSKIFAEIYTKHKKEKLQKLIKKMKEYNLGVEIEK